jgi:hypothetical protein
MGMTYGYGYRAYGYRPETETTPGGDDESRLGAYGYSCSYGYRCQRQRQTIFSVRPAAWVAGSAFCDFCRSSCMMSPLK